MIATLTPYYAVLCCATMMPDREDLGVFFCGPKILSTKLHMMCNQHTDQAAETRFFYHKENF